MPKRVQVSVGAERAFWEEISGFQRKTGAVVVLPNGSEVESLSLETERALVDAMDTE